MKKSFIKLLITLLFTTTALTAQSIRTSVDWAVFEYDENNVYLELYYSFPQSDLTFAEDDGRQTATTLCQLKLYNDSALFKEFAWKSQTVANDPNVLSEEKEVIDIMGFSFQPGEYQCTFIIKDLSDETKTDSTTWNLKAKLPKASGAYLSELELASSIRYAQENEKQLPFYKNGLYIEPNPTLVFSFEKPALFFYVEAYALSKANLSNGYKLSYHIIDQNGDIVKDVKPRVMKKSQIVDPSVEYGMLNVGKLAAGTYHLIVALLDDQNNELAQQQKKFFVFSKEVFTSQPEVLRYDDSVFAQMDSADVETEFLMVYYLLKKDQQEIHKLVENLKAKRNFLYGFWSRNNIDNFREEYVRRFRMANERYKAFRVDGWRTDRGRVLMVYGEPDDMDRFPNKRDVHPYEVWYYNSLQNGVKFIFADIEGHNNYRLIHSNMLGEVQDPYYMNTIQKSF